MHSIGWVTADFQKKTDSVDPTEHRDHIKSSPFSAVFYNYSLHGMSLNV